MRMPIRRRASFQRLYRTKSYPSGQIRKEPASSERDESDWCLTDSDGYTHKLPKTMIFLGKEECDIEVQTNTVDKRHAVVTFDTYLHRFKIKDLSTTHGTFVNSTRIPEQEYVTLDQDDCVQLGEDPVLYKMERCAERAGHHDNDDDAHDAINRDHEELRAPVFAQSDRDLPSWASHTHNNNQDGGDGEKVKSPLAECEGCIAEQRIEHTCSENIPESEAAHRDLDRSYSHDSIATFSLGCNTWPKKRHKPKKSVKEIFAMVDSSPPPLEDTMGDANDARQTRILRGTGAPMNILPDELETVKKGTPLYGQPEWWGEEDDYLSTEKQRAKGMEIAHPDNPGAGAGDPGSAEGRTNVSNNTGDTSDPTSSDTTTRPSDLDTGITNMAFTVDFGDEQKALKGKSLSDFVPSKIRKSFRERKEKSIEKTATTPTKPTSKALTQPAKLPAKEKASVETPVKSSRDKTVLESRSSFRDKVTPEKSSSFRERNTPDKSSSFRERTTPDKSSSYRERTTPEKSSSFRDKVTPEKIQTSRGIGRAQSEGRDFSPTRQRKLDDLWNSGASTASSSETSLNKRQRMLGSGKTAASRSVDMDSDSHEASYTKPTKTSTVKRRGLTNASSAKSRSVIRARKAVSQEILASSTQYNNEQAIYLLDKMFRDNSTGSVDSLKAKDPTTSMTEYDLYHEAIKFDVDPSKLLQNDSGISSSASKSVTTTKNNRSKDTTNTNENKHVPTAATKKSKEESVPVPVVNKEEDKVSESGTYTIEEEQDAQEEEEARKNIDKVFGVDQVSFNNGGLTLTEDLKLVRVSSGDKQEELAVNLEHLNTELAEIEQLERLRAARPPPDSLEVDIGSRDPSDLLEGDEDNPTVPSDAPKWVTQWAALTTKKSPGSKSDMELSSPGSSISDDRDSKTNGKTPNGISRKRPGTGRRLPTIPPEATSPAASDRSFTKESPQTPKSDLSINGMQLSPNQQQRSVKISSHVSARYQDTDSESISRTKYDDDSSTIADQTMSGRGKSGSNGSVVSIDTEVLLRDTETVMAAMQERVDKSNEYSNSDIENGDDPLDTERLLEGAPDEDSSRYSLPDTSDSYILSESIDLESDTSSCVALVNGDEDFVKPSAYQSPRQVLGRSKLKMTAESLPSKPSVNLSGAKMRNSTSDRAKRRSVDERTLVSDIYSEDNVTERSDAGQFSRQGSKGKGQMSMTRPNRAFALRRARADGDDVPETSRSSSQLSIASTGFSTPRGSGSLTNISSKTSSHKPQRPMSGKFSDRGQPDSARSQGSLGAQIVQKSRENGGLTQSQNLVRSDGGRHSLRVARSLSIPQQDPGHAPGGGSSTSKPTRKSTSGSTPSNQLGHSRSLRVTGVGARERSSSLSKNNGTNSPKSAERNAWKRRKEYDPRKAVADAKSKSKDTSGKHKPSPRESNSYSSSSSRTRGVTRSASFNNAKDLKLSSYQCDSLSSADEYSRRSSNVSDVFEDEPRRGFVPYSARSLISSKVSNSSADEDELDKYVRSSSTASTQALPKHGVAVHSNMSAFTPPPSKPKLPLTLYRKTTPPHYTRTTSSVQSRLSASRSKIKLKTPEPVPATSMSMSEHRRSVDSLVLYKSALGRRPDSSVKESPRVPESYDTLIVSSVYQLSLKLKTLTEHTMNKLRESEAVENGLESPLDELENMSAHSAVSEIPAYKSANQELASVLKNLRKLEQHIKVMNKVLFPDEELSPDTSKEKHEYMQQIERIRSELAGFQPIETPRTDDVWKTTETASVESDCEELSHSEYY